MLFVDAHCDILSRIQEPEQLFSNHYHWDAKRALSNGPFIQVFSLFAQGSTETEIKDEMEAQLKLITLAENEYPSRLKIIKSNDDISNIKGQVGCIIEAEGAEIIGNSLDEIDRLYDAGLRILTLCWNNDNRVCDSIAGKKTHNGLSEFGYQVVEKAQDKGIIIDVSHASDKTFYDIAQIAKGAFIASHSNCRTLCSNKRNLTDDQIKTIAKNHGFIGINLYANFLNNMGNAHMLDIIKHIDYIAALVGISTIGFGCDFDGVDRLPQNINGVEDTSKIIDRLLQLNYSEEDVKGIAGFNFLRVLENQALDFNPK